MSNRKDPRRWLIIAALVIAALVAVIGIAAVAATDPARPAPAVTPSRLTLTGSVQSPLLPFFHDRQYSAGFGPAPLLPTRPAMLILPGLGLLTAVTGYFVAQEFSYVAVDRGRLRREADAGDRAAARALMVTVPRRRPS